MRNYIKEFFYLQRDDRRAVLTLLALAVVALSLIFWLGESSSPPPTAKKNKLSRKGQQRIRQWKNQLRGKILQSRGGKSRTFPLRPQHGRQHTATAPGSCAMASALHLSLSSQRWHIPPAVRLRPPLWTDSKAISGAETLHPHLARLSSRRRLLRTPPHRQ